MMSNKKMKEDTDTSEVLHDNRLIHIENLLEQMYQYSIENVYCDTMIQTATGPVFAHSIVLASANQKFKSMLQIHTQSNCPSKFIIDLNEVSCSSFSVRFILQYCYTGRFKLIDENHIEQTLALAKYLDIELIVDNSLYYKEQSDDKEIVTQTPVEKSKLKTTCCMDSEKLDHFDKKFNINDNENRCPENEENNEEISNMTPTDSLFQDSEEKYSEKTSNIEESRCKIIQSARSNKVKSEMNLQIMAEVVSAQKYVHPTREEHFNVNDNCEACAILDHSVKEDPTIPYETSLSDNNYEITKLKSPNKTISNLTVSQLKSNLFSGSDSNVTILNRPSNNTDNVETELCSKSSTSAGMIEGELTVKNTSETVTCISGQVKNTSETVTSIIAGPEMYNLIQQQSQIAPTTGNITIQGHQSPYKGVPLNQPFSLPPIRHILLPGYNAIPVNLPFTQPASQLLNTQILSEHQSPSITGGNKSNIVNVNIALSSQQHLSDQLVSPANNFPTERLPIDSQNTTFSVINMADISSNKEAMPFDNRKTLTQPLHISAVNTSVLSPLKKCDPLPGRVNVPSTEMIRLNSSHRPLLHMLLSGPDKNQTTHLPIPLINIAQKENGQVNENVPVTQVKQLSCDIPTSIQLENPDTIITSDASVSHFSNKLCMDTEEIGNHCFSNSISESTAKLSIKLCHSSTTMEPDGNKVGFNKQTVRASSSLPSSYLFHDQLTKTFAAVGDNTLLCASNNKNVDVDDIHTLISPVTGTNESRSTKCFRFDILEDIATDKTKKEYPTNEIISLNVSRKTINGRSECAQSVESEKLKGFTVPSENKSIMHTNECLLSTDSSSSPVLSRSINEDDFSKLQKSDHNYTAPHGSISFQNSQDHNYTLDVSSGLNTTLYTVDCPDHEFAKSSVAKMVADSKDEAPEMYMQNGQEHLNGSYINKVKSDEVNIDIANDDSINTSELSVCSNPVSVISGNDECNLYDQHLTEEYELSGNDCFTNIAVSSTNSTGMLEETTDPPPNKCVRQLTSPETCSEHSVSPNSSVKHHMSKDEPIIQKQKKRKSQLLQSEQERHITKKKKMTPIVSITLEEKIGMGKKPRKQQSPKVKAMIASKVCDPKSTKSTVRLTKRQSEQNNTKLKIPIVTSDKQNGFRCEHCPMKYEEEKALAEHMKHHVRTQQNSFTCSICGLKFPNTVVIQEHRKKDHVLPFICPEKDCSYGFETEEKLLSHRHSKHHMPLNLLETYFPHKYKLNRCQHKDCSYECLDMTSMRYHVKTTHGSDRPYVCELCGLKFKARSTLSCHKVNIHEDHSGRQKHACVQCGKEFKTHSSMVQHQRRLHEGLKEQFPCQQCDFQGYDKRKLLTHMWAEHDVEPPDKYNKFECTQCGYRCLQKGAFQIHQRRHAGERKFECEICGRSYVSASELTSHKEYHKDPTARKFKCELCAFTAINMVKLKKHVENVHSRTDDKPYKCEVTTCEYKTNIRGNLVMHLRKTHKIKVETKKTIQKSVLRTGRGRVNPKSFAGCTNNQKAQNSEGKVQKKSQRSSRKKLQAKEMQAQISLLATTQLMDRQVESSQSNRSLEQHSAYQHNNLLIQDGSNHNGSMLGISITESNNVINPQAFLQPNPPVFIVNYNNKSDSNCSDVASTVTTSTSAAERKYLSTNLKKMVSIIKPSMSAELSNSMFIMPSTLEEGNVLHIPQQGIMEQINHLAFPPLTESLNSINNGQVLVTSPQDTITSPSSNLVYTLPQVGSSINNTSIMNIKASSATTSNHMPSDIGAINSNEGLSEFKDTGLLNNLLNDPNVVMLKPQPEDLSVRNISDEERPMAELQLLGGQNYTFLDIN